MRRLDCTNLKRRDGQRFVVLVQGDEGEEGWDCTILLLLSQRGDVYQHLNLHWLVTDEREPPRHCHHTAWGRLKRNNKDKYVWFDLFLSCGSILCTPTQLERKLLYITSNFLLYNLISQLLHFEISIFDWISVNHPGEIRFVVIECFTGQHNVNPSVWHRKINLAQQMERFLNPLHLSHYPSGREPIESACKGKAKLGRSLVFCLSYSRIPTRFVTPSLAKS